MAARRSVDLPAGRTRMHAGEVLTEPALVRALLLDQFPALAELPLELVPSFGTDHDVYRVGSELSARLPRIAWALRQAETEAAWMPRFAPHLPVAVPEVVSTGVPGHGYPFAWSLHRWLPGEAATTASFDRDEAALDLARCIHALQAIPTTGAHPRLPGARGGPLLEADAGVRDAAARLDPTRDEGMEEAEVVAAWDRSLAVPAYQGPGVWVHGDLLPGNLLLDGERLSAVIDWGGLNVGDPACDLQPAWHVFEGSSRDRFRDAMDVDGATWRRGRGWALQAVVGIDYYRDTNPSMHLQGIRAVRAALEDWRRDP